MEAGGWFGETELNLSKRIRYEDNQSLIFRSEGAEEKIETDYLRVKLLLKSGQYIYKTIF